MLISRPLRDEQYQQVGYWLAVRCIERDRRAESCEDGDRSLQAFDARVWNRDPSPQSRGPKRFPLSQTHANLFRIQAMASSQKVSDGVEGLVLAVCIEVQNDVLVRQQISDGIARVRRCLGRIASNCGTQKLFHDHSSAAERCSGGGVTAKEDWRPRSERLQYRCVARHATDRNVALPFPALSTSFAMGRVAFMAIPSHWFMTKARTLGRNTVSGFSACV